MPVPIQDSSLLNRVRTCIFYHLLSCCLTWCPTSFLGWKKLAYSFLFLFDGIFFFIQPSPSQASTSLSHLILPALPPGAGGAKRQPGMWFMGRRNGNRISLLVSKYFLSFYLNLWYERQFRSTLYNVQLRVYGNGREPHHLIPCRLIGAEDNKYICLWICCRPQHTLEHREHWILHYQIMILEDSSYIKGNRVVGKKKSLSIPGDQGQESYIVYSSEIGLDWTPMTSLKVK